MDNKDVVKTIGYVNTITFVEIGLLVGYSIILVK